MKVEEVLANDRYYDAWMKFYDRDPKAVHVIDDQPMIWKKFDTKANPNQKNGLADLWIAVYTYTPASGR